MSLFETLEVRQKLHATLKYTQSLVQKFSSFQSLSEQMKATQYVNAKLNIGLVNWREAWLLNKPYPQQLITEQYRGAIVFRIPGTSRRISYKKLKQGLCPARIVIVEEPLPF